MTLSVIPLRIGACMGRLFIILLCSGLMLAGCASDLPFPKDKKADEEGVSGAANQETEGEAEPLVYYVGVESLRLYEQPRTSGNFIADLEQHQKVYRYKIEKGFAWVKVDGTDMTGWVVNAKLIWRHEAMDVNTQEGETAPTDSSEPRSQSVDPSKFDAF
jgi:hypothetical protein